MGKKELDRQINQHPQVATNRKATLVMGILWLIASVVMLFFNRLLGIVFLCIFPLYCLMMWASISSLKRKVRRQIESSKEEQFEAIRMPAVRKEVSRSNSVANVVASYAIGKAVTSKANDSPLTKNPYAERYAKSIKELNDNRSTTTQMSQKQRVTLSNGRGAYLHTMPNGSQQLVDFGGRMIARYDSQNNRTTEGNTKVIGKGNLITQFLSN